MTAFLKTAGTRTLAKPVPVCVLLALAPGLMGQTQVSVPQQAGTSDLEVNRAPPEFSPVTEGERARRYLKSLVSPIALFNSAASAGLGQWRDRPAEWRQGSEGYGRRFASAFAQHIVRDTLIFGASSILQEDNRYLRSGETGFTKRVGYALESTVTARHNDGSRHVSISKIAAFAGAALISREWQPKSSRGLSSAGINFGTSIAVGAGFEVTREFLPGLLH